MKRLKIALGVIATAMVVLCGLVVKPVFAEERPEKMKDWKEAKIGEYVYNYYYKDGEVEVAKDVDAKTIGDITYYPKACGAADVNKVYYQSLSECNVKRDEEGEGLMVTINVIINVVLGVLGFITVAMIIMGGIGFATSQGDAGKTAKARNTILFGIVGLVIALLAFAIVNFVLGNVFKGGAA